MAKVVLKFDTSADGVSNFELDDGDIVNLDSLYQSTPDASTINYGCIANTGSIDIIDYNGQIADMIDSGSLPASNVGVDVFFNGNKLQSHITTDSSYDENSKNFSISLSNTIKDLSARTFSGYKYPNQSATLYDLLYCVMNEWYGRKLDEETEFKPMMSGIVFHKGALLRHTIYDYLGYIELKYPVIEPNQTFETVFNQICTVAQLQMFIDKNGKFKFVSNRAIGTLDKIIHIPLRNISGDFKKDVFVKNNYKGVEVDEYSVVDEIKYNQQLYTTNPIDSSSVVLPPSFYYNESDVNYNVDTNVSGINIGDLLEYKKVAVAVTATKSYYLTGSFSIPIKGNNNLEQIDSVYNQAFTSEGNPRFNLRCIKKLGGCSVAVSPSTKQIRSNFSLNIPSGGTEYLGYPPQEVSTTYTSSGLFQSSATSRTKNTDTSTISSTKDEKNGVYNITFKILVGQDNVKMGRDYTINTDLDEDTTVLTMTGQLERYEPVSVEISIYGTKRIISFNQNAVKSEGFYETENTVSVAGSHLLSDKTTLGQLKISDEISKDILLDYSNGIKTAKLTIVPVDYYTTSGEKAVDGYIGELIQVGDIVEVEGQKNKNGELIKWRVTSSNFKYDGEPLQELELMELVTMVDTRLSYFTTVTGKAYQVTSYNSTISGNLTLGGQYDDGENGLMDVVAIAERGFSGCENIREVVINAPIKTIFQRAFAYSGITKITFNTVAESGTGDLVCDSCYSLTQVYLLGELYGIGDRAFIDCHNLKEVYIGKNVQHISQYAFANCNSLTDVYYEGSEEDWNNMYYKSQTGNNLLYNATFHFNYAMR